MKHSLLASSLTATVLMLAAGCATLGQPEREPLTLDQIVALSKEGKDAPTIIAALKAGGGTYDVTASQYAKLSRDGVPDAVLDYMQQGQIRLAERVGRRQVAFDPWMGPSWYGYGPYWYPRSYLVYVRGAPYVRHW